MTSKQNHATALRTQPFMGVHSNSSDRPIESWADAKALLDVFNSYQPELNLTRLELPQVQEVLRRITASPKFREWIVAPSLNKEMLKVLNVHHFMKDMIRLSFIGLIKQFWMKHEKMSKAKAKYALRKKSRSFEAMRLLNIERSELDWQRAKREQELSDLIDEQIRTYRAMALELQHSYFVMSELYESILINAAIDFASSMQSDPVISPLVANIETVRIEGFAKEFIDLRVKGKAVIDALKEERDAIKDMVEPKAELASLRNKIAAQLRHERNALRAMPERIAIEHNIPTLAQACRDDNVRVYKHLKLLYRINPQVPDLMVCHASMVSVAQEKEAIECEIHRLEGMKQELTCKNEEEALLENMARLNIKTQL